MEDIMIVYIHVTGEVGVIVEVDLGATVVGARDEIEEIVIGIETVEDAEAEVQGDRLGTVAVEVRV